MREASIGGPLWTPEMVVTAFQDAMQTLSRLPPGGYSTKLCQPQREIVREEVLEMRAAPSEMRHPAPSGQKIDEMERTLRWLRLIPQERFVLRRVVGLRAITHHVSGKPLSWRKVASRLGADHRAVVRWHESGIAIIAGKLNELQVKPADPRD